MKGNFPSGNEKKRTYFRFEVEKYFQFAVGAALLCADGTTILGDWKDHNVSCKRCQEQKLWVYFILISWIIFSLSKVAMWRTHPMVWPSVQRGQQQWRCCDHHFIVIMSDFWEKYLKLSGAPLWFAQTFLSRPSSSILIGCFESHRWRIGKTTSNRRRMVVNYELEKLLG